jgi:SAM-dependent methyltransferase
MIKSDLLDPEILDSNLYLITYCRSSGNKHIVKLRFTKNTSNSVCILSKSQKAKTPDWLDNIVADSTGSSYITSRMIFGKVTKVTLHLEQSEISAVLASFERKYGKSLFIGKHALDYSHSRAITIAFRPEAFPRYSISELEFDFQARSYSHSILSNPISKWQRSVTSEHLARIFRVGNNVLEIGCGTGIETIPLARKGVHVLATDISEEMLQLLEKRAAKSEVSALIKIRKLSSSDIDEIRNDPFYPAAGFDGAFSHFGALNLEPNLREFSKKLSPLLRANSLVSFAIWNRICFCDILANILGRKSHRTRERMHGQVSANDDSKYSLDTCTYDPSQFASMFPEFEKVSLFALPTLIPPSEYSRKFSFLLKLGILDRELGKLPFFRSIGDNFVLTMRKK